MAIFGDETLTALRERVDIVEVVGRYLHLERRGQNWKGLCPFHGEQTPSFNVNPARRGYKCFGCGVGGDAIRFVQEIEGISFPEAVRRLADEFGVALPKEAVAAAARRTAQERALDDAYALQRLATDLYRTILVEHASGATGRDYVQARGIEPATAERFRLGYAPAPGEAGWDTLARLIAARGMPLELAEQLGLVARSERRGTHYDRFRGRLMFPVVQPGGEVIAFSGRVVPPHDRGSPDDPAPPKYVNSPESPLYRKGRALYGLDAARAAIRQRGRAILVEGNVDVVMLHQRGHDEALAPLGTALTAEQCRLLGRFTKDVVLAFDGDNAGKQAAAAALPLLLDEGFHVRLLLLPEGMDPDSAPPELFRERLEAAQPALEVLMQRLAARAGKDIEARMKGLARALPLIAKVKGELAQDLYAERAAQLFDVAADRVRRDLRGLAAGSGGGDPGLARTSTSSRNVAPSAAVVGTSTGRAAGVARLRPLPDAQAQLTAMLLDLPHLVGEALRLGAPDLVTDARLAPILNTALVHAERATKPSLDELMALLPEAARTGPLAQQEQRQIYEEVLSGRYLDPGGDAQLRAGAAEELKSLIRRCQEDRLQAEIGTLDERIRHATAHGDTEALRNLTTRRLELRRRQADLRSLASAT